MRYPAACCGEYSLSSVDKFSKKLKLSSFAVSFIILGLLTSTPEFAVGLTAVAENKTEVYVGNLLGGIPVIFLLIIPILAIFGNGIKLNHDFDTKHLLASLVVIAAPFFLILDKEISKIDGIIFILLYVFLILFIERKHGFLDKSNTQALNIKVYSYKDLIKILFGIGIVFITSQIIVGETLYFSKILNVSAFYISLIFLSIGTNLPELSLAVRSIFSGKKDIAFGDYMGSAAANTFLFGIFTILNNQRIVSVDSFSVIFTFGVGALFLFYIFSHAKSIISRRSGIFLLVLYLVFVFLQFKR